MPPGPAAFLVLNRPSSLLTLSEVKERGVEVEGWDKMVMERDGVCERGEEGLKLNLFKNIFNLLAKPWSSHDPVKSLQ